MERCWEISLITVGDICEVGGGCFDYCGALPVKMVGVLRLLWSLVREVGWGVAITVEPCL